MINHYLVFSIWGNKIYLKTRMFHIDIVNVSNYPISNQRLRN